VNSPAARMMRNTTHNRAQLPHELLAAVRASAHTKIAFSAEDSEDAKATAPLFPGLRWEDLMALDKHQVVVRLCVDGHTGPTFTGYTLDVPESLGEDHAQGLIRAALERWPAVCRGGGKDTCTPGTGLSGSPGFRGSGVQSWRLPNGRFQLTAFTWPLDETRTSERDRRPNTRDG
jgi:hypothetical protein